MLLHEIQEQLKITRLLKLVY